MADDIRVLHQVNLRNGAWGGMEKHFARLIRTSMRHGIRNYVSDSLRDPAPEVAEALASLDAPAMDYRRWHGVPLPKRPAVLRRANRQIQARHWRIDRVLNWNVFGDVDAARLAQALGARSFYWERGAAWYEQSRAVDAAFRDAYSLYLANSEASRQMLLQRWDVRGDVRLCSPGVAPGVAPRTQPRELPSGRPLRIGFAARLRSFKGGVLAVHAIERLARRGFAAELHVAGEGPDLERMQAQARRLQIASRLRVHGRLSSMDGFYDDIDLMLHPALREPYGLSCAEALSVGVPVVATCVDGLPEVIRNGVDGYCVAPSLDLANYAGFGGDPGDVYPLVYRPERGVVAAPGFADPEALADAVARIVSDTDRYRDFSAAALRAYAERFNWERQLARLAELLR